MENYNDKTLWGVANDVAKRAIYGTAEVSNEVVKEAVPATKCGIRTAAKLIHHTGEVLLRGTVTLGNHMERAHSSSEVNKRLGMSTDFETLKSANALPNGVETLEQYSEYLNKQLNY